jgi:hypothetical protein
MEIVLMGYKKGPEAFLLDCLACLKRFWRVQPIERTPWRR